MIRGVAGYDHDRARLIFRTWPVRELLEAYTDVLRREALAQYRFEYLAWSALRANAGPNFKPPGIPRVLVEMKNGSGQP